MEISRTKTVEPKPTNPVVDVPRGEGITPPAPVVVTADPGLTALGVDLSGLATDPFIADYPGTGARSSMTYRVERFGDKYAVRPWENDPSDGWTQPFPTLNEARNWAKDLAEGRAPGYRQISETTVDQAEERIQAFINIGRASDVRLTLEDGGASYRQLALALENAVVGADLCQSAVDAIEILRMETGEEHPNLVKHEQNLAMITDWKNALVERLAETPRQEWEQRNVAAEGREWADAVWMNGPYLAEANRAKVFAEQIGWTAPLHAFWATASTEQKAAAVERVESLNRTRSSRVGDTGIGFWGALGRMDMNNKLMD